jgi:hypothetical protein
MAMKDEVFGENETNEDEFVEDYEGIGENEPDKWLIDVSVSLVRTSEGRKIKLDVSAEIDPKHRREAREEVHRCILTLLKSSRMLD